MVMEAGRKGFADFPTNGQRLLGVEIEPKAVRIG